MSAACVAAAPARLLLLRRTLAASRSALSPRMLSLSLWSLLPVLYRCGPLLLVLLLLLMMMLPLEPCRCRDAVLLLALPVWRAQDVAHDLLVQRVQGLDGRCG